MNKVINSQTAPHFAWGNKCDGWWLLKSAKFTVIEERMLAGSAEKKHKHTQTDQFFYCLTGEMQIELEQETYTLLTGDGLFIPAGAIHKVKADQNEARFLVISCPNHQEDRIDLE